MQRNARFWVWANDGWVKLTLRPGQELAHRYGGATDEGWYRGEDGWRHDGDEVTSWCESEATDCDGRLDESFVFACPLDKLRARDMHAEEQERAELWGENPTLPQFNENVGIFTPVWSRVRSSQRDYAAEAAGY